MSKLPKATMNLKQFMLRVEVLKLYKDIFRTLRKVPDEKTRLELRDWARSDFRQNMHHTDEFTIKSLLNHGKKSIEQLKQSLHLSGE